MTRPADLLTHSRQNVALAYRRAADAALVAAEAWATVDPGVPDVAGHHLRLIASVQRAEDAIGLHDATAAGLARGARQ